MTEKSTKSNTLFRVIDIFLVLVLLTGAYLRTAGLDWDEGQHLHPDERFLTMVESENLSHQGMQPAGHSRRTLPKQPEGLDVLFRVFQHRAIHAKPSQPRIWIFRLRDFAHLHGTVHS